MGPGLLAIIMSGHEEYLEKNKNRNIFDFAKKTNVYGDDDYRFTVYRFFKHINMEDIKQSLFNCLIYVYCHINVNKNGEDVNNEINTINNELDKYNLFTIKKNNENQYNFHCKFCNEQFYEKKLIMDARKNKYIGCKSCRYLKIDKKEEINI